MVSVASGALGGICGKGKCSVHWWNDEIMKFAAKLCTFDICD